MLDGFLVRSENRSATTDANGRAQLVLPVGPRTLDVTRIGFTPKRIPVTIIADSIVTVFVDVAMEDKMHAMEAVVVSATRTERLVEQTPLRVEVVDEMEVDENTLMAPSGITMLLNETPGLRVQSANPALGTGSVRILGLPGQYTAMLSDGLPLYGGVGSALGPLDVSPVDLRRVELIKGAASSLYGGQALGGVINLISKQPTGESQALINRRTMGVTDAATWMSRRFGEHAGASLLVSGTTQERQDVDDDGWTDQPDAERWSVRPRYSYAGENGRSMFATAGYSYDNRDGGHALSREALKGRRTDAGLTLRQPLPDSAHLAARVAFSSNRRDRVFRSGPVERDWATTGFAELTWVKQDRTGASVLGATVQGDGYENEQASAFDHSWLTPSVFATREHDVGPLTFSLSGRADFHPTGTQLTERVAVLARASEEWSIRVSGGNGWAPPTSMTEEVEAIGHSELAHTNLLPERSMGAMVDVNGHALGAEILVTGYGSSISRAIQLMDPNTINNPPQLRNAAGATRVAGVEGAAIWRFGGDHKFLLTYGHARGSRTDALSGTREPMPLLNRHRAGADLMLEEAGVYLIGIEAIYYGRQVLDDNPYLSESKPYLYTMAIAKRQFGRVEIVANFENLLNIRMTDYHSLVAPSPGAGGRRTMDVWAPLEGFMANLALRYRWGSG